MITALFESLDERVSLRDIPEIGPTYYLETCSGEGNAREVLKRRIFDLAYNTIDSSPVYKERKQ